MPRRLLLACVLALSLLALQPLPLATAVPSKRAWLADVADAMSGSHTYVDQRAQQGGPRLAVNLDIDNTSLASHYDPGEPVERVLRFARYARSRGMVLLFNTARLAGDGRLRAARRQLERAGYRVTKICGRMRGESLSHSKQRCRQRFVGAGYTLVANVGNRDTDFAGGNYERAYRLPNYDNQLT